MKRARHLLAITVLATSIGSFSSSAYADDLSIKILEVPMLKVNTQGLKTGTNGKVDLAFFEPYSVEFNGGAALKVSSCEQLLDAITGLETIWTTAGITNKSSIERSNVLYTIGLTKTGIQCALSRRVRTWWGTDYTFAAGEQSVPMTVSINLAGVKMAEKTGILRNPNFSPPAPSIFGVNRGDTVNGYLKFKLEGKLPEASSKTSPSLGLCPPDVSLSAECGWGYLEADGNAVIVANPNSYGKSVTLIVRWDITNETGNDVFIESKLIGLNVSASDSPIPSQIMAKLSQLKIDLDLDCGSSNLSPGAEIKCRIYPKLFYSRPNFGTFETKLKGKLDFRVMTKSDNCELQSSKISLLLNQDNIYILRIPKETTSIFTAKFAPANSSWRLSTENIYPGSEPGTVVFGGNPESFGYSAGSGKSCHIYSNRAARSVPAVPTGKVDKSSNAYKKMFAVGKNFGKVSQANDTARSQCTSALQSGVIRANGIPKYLGSQTTLIQSYLKTSSGFQGCLDGFGR